MDKPMLSLPEQFPAGAPILVAFSGGADSTLLLHLLCKHARAHGSALYAVHVHHGIRGGEADRDAEFCRQTCRTLGVPLFSVKVNVPALARARGQSLELAAREARYRHFARLMKRHGIRYLATAHHADDNLETLLFRLCRGTGTAGMRGIRALSPLPGTEAENLYVLRPLLHLTKQEILDACRDLELAFVTDSTNTCNDYARNRIRNRIIPELETLFAHPQHAAARLSRAAAEDCEALDAMAEQIFLEQVKNGKISAGLLCSLSTALAKRVIVLLFDSYAKQHREGLALMPEAVHVEAILAQVRAGQPGSISLPGKLAAHVDRDGLCIGEDKLPDTAQPYLVKLEQEFCEIAGADIAVWAQFPANTETITPFDTNVYNLYTEVRVRFDTIKGAIFLRPIREGDVILSGGMHKKIRKLYGQSGTPLSLRPRLPLLIDADGILAVPGICVRDGAQADSVHPTLTVRIYLMK